MKAIIRKYLNKASEFATDSSYLYIPFGIFGIITYPLFYIIWIITGQNRYENLPMRLVTIALCIGLTLKNYWPTRLKPFLPVYWYVTLTYSLPFLFTYFLFKNNFSSDVVLDTLAIVVLCILLMEWVALCIVLTLGISLAILLYYLTSKKALYIPPDYTSILITYVSVLLFGALFAHRKDKFQQEKINSMKALGSNIAHELRTPLATLENSIHGIQRYYPTLLGSYTLAKKAGLPVETIHAPHFKILENVFDDTILEIRYAQLVIDSILQNVNDSFNLNTNKEKCLISTCIKNALSRYPFNSDKQKNLVHWNASNDFLIEIDKFLFTHILFNLIKNALYFIDKAQGGEISIWLESGKKYNQLHFKDTGFGISPKNLKKIFDRFFTTERHGSGLGLSFCRTIMKAAGGNITCVSKLGEHTEFILTFPKVTST